MIMSMYTYNKRKIKYWKDSLNCWACWSRDGSFSQDVQSYPPAVRPAFWNFRLNFIILMFSKRQFLSLSWWALFKHLCWSLLGIEGLDPLDSGDSASVTLAQLLYGAFLIRGVVLLVNVMIALLSNTYQRVEVTNFGYFLFFSRKSVYNCSMQILSPIHDWSNSF